MSYHYYRKCVGWPPDDVREGLSPMCDSAIDISRRTFIKHADPRDLEDLAEVLGYEKHHTQGLTMAGDWHISYHRSKLHGRRVYFLRWSGIEYVFTQGDDHGMD